MVVQIIIILQIKWKVKAILYNFYSLSFVRSYKGDAMNEIKEIVIVLVGRSSSGQKLRKSVILNRAIWYRGQESRPINNNRERFPCPAIKPTFCYYLWNDIFVAISPFLCKWDGCTTSSSWALIIHPLVLVVVIMPNSITILYLGRLSRPLQLSSPVPSLLWSHSSGCVLLYLFFYADLLSFIPRRAPFKGPEIYPFTWGYYD